MTAWFPSAVPLLSRSNWMLNCTSVAGADQSPCVAMPKYTQLPLRTAPTCSRHRFAHRWGHPPRACLEPARDAELEGAHLRLVAARLGAGVDAGARDADRAPSPPVASTNGSVADVVDAGLAAAYTGTRSAGPVAGATVHEAGGLAQPLSRQDDRRRLRRPSAPRQPSARACSASRALAASWTSERAAAPGGHRQRVPSGNEYETPGIDVRGVEPDGVRLRRRAVVVDADRLRARSAPSPPRGRRTRR